MSEKRRGIRHLLQAAEQKLRDANKTRELAEVFAFRALLARQDGNVLEAVTWAKQAMAWLPPEERRWRNVALTVVGVGEILEGHLNRAYDSLLEALALSEAQGNTSYARATRGMMAGASLERGELRQPAEQFRQMQAEARAQEDRDDIARTQLGLAHIAYQWNNLDEAEQEAEEALALGEQMKVEEFQALAIIRLAMIEHARGQMGEAQQRLTAWLVRGNAGRTEMSALSYQLSRLVQAARVRIQIANSDVLAAERWFAGIEGREEPLPLLQRWREQLLHARLLLAQGAEAKAIEEMEHLCAVTLETGHILVQLETQVTLVMAYEKQRRHEEARELLRDLLERTKGEGFVRLFLDEGKEMADLLHKLSPHMREKGLMTHIQRILQAFAHESGMPTPSFEATSSMSFLLEPLSPQEQKVLCLLAAGNSNAEIARELVVSVNTVRTQVQSIYRKLNVNNRVEASSVARQLDLV